MALPMSWTNAARAATWPFEPELLGHDAGEEGDFLRMVEHVLAVAGAELQAAHQPQDFGMEVEEAELERRGLAVLADRVLHLGLDLLDDLLDAGRVDAAVGDEALDRLARDLAAERIEAREDDRAGRVVDDQLDAGGGLEGADVAALAADDAALEVVARQVDDRHRRLDGVLGGAALDGVGDDLLRAHGGGLARLGFEALDEVGGVAAGVCLDLLEQELAGLVGGEAGDALRARAAGRRAVGRRGSFAAAAAASAGRRSAPSRAAPARARSQVGQPIGERAGLVRQRLFETPDLVAPLPLVLVRLGGSRVRLFARFERGFLAQALGVAFGLAHEPFGLGLRAADVSSAIRRRLVHPPGDGGDAASNRTREGRGGERAEGIGR